LVTGYNFIDYIKEKGYLILTIYKLRRAHMSKGENKITDLLNQAGIKFQREKSFSDLKHGLFRYDFYIPNLDGGPVIIEFNGEQHYHFVGKFFRTRRDW
jgi:hypothetical protein